LEGAKKLEETLTSFGVSAKVVNVTRGPTVTRYELSPSAGVKGSRIVNLSDDIALNLAAPGIRIEAPIRGRLPSG
jgi:S-DNA-T family DNA segregation ATPase FtsK/SpoIIIE